MKNEQYCDLNKITFFQEISVFTIILTYAQVDDCLSLILQLHRAASLQTVEHRHMVKKTLLSLLPVSIYAYIFRLQQQRMGDRH